MVSNIDKSQQHQLACPLIVILCIVIGFSKLRMNVIIYEFINLQKF